MHADVPTYDRYVNHRRGVEKGPRQPTEGKSYNASWSNFLGGTDEWAFGFREPSPNILFYIPYINSRLFGPIPAVFIFPGDIISRLHRVQSGK